MMFLTSVGKYLGAVVVGVTLFSVTAHASTLLQNLPNSTALVGVQADASTGAWSEPVSLAGPATITGLTWWGYYGFGSDLSTDSFQANGVNLSSTGLLTRSLYGSVDDGFGGLVDLYQYFLDLSDPANSVSFAGGAATLSLANDSLDVEWYWQGAGVDETGARAFSIDGTRQVQSVPEPSSLALFGLAFLGLGLATVRARKPR